MEALGQTSEKMISVATKVARNLDGQIAGRDTSRGESW